MAKKKALKPKDPICRWCKHPKSQHQPDCRQCSDERTDPSEGAEPCFNFEPLP